MGFLGEIMRLNFTYVVTRGRALRMPDLLESAIELALARLYIRTQGEQPQEIDGTFRFPREFIEANRTKVLELVCQEFPGPDAVCEARLGNALKVLRLPD